MAPALENQPFERLQEQITKLDCRIDDLESKVQRQEQMLCKKSNILMHMVDKVEKESKAHKDGLERKLLNTLNHELKDMFQSYSGHQNEVVEDRLMSMVAFYNRVPEYYESVDKLKAVVDMETHTMKQLCKDVQGRLRHVQDEVQGHMIEFTSRLDRFSDEYEFLSGDLRHQQNEFVQRLETKQRLLDNKVQEALKSMRAITASGSCSQTSQCVTAAMQFKNKVQATLGGNEHSLSKSGGRSSASEAIKPTGTPASRSSSRAASAPPVSFRDTLFRHAVESIQVKIERNPAELANRGLLTEGEQAAAIRFSVRARSLTRER